MEGKREIFVDGIGQIHFTGGMVRFDFVTLQPKEGENPTTEVVQRVIMPPQGFLSTFSSMQQLIDKLVEAGVLHGAGEPVPGLHGVQGLRWLVYRPAQQRAAAIVPMPGRGDSRQPEDQRTGK